MVNAPDGQQHRQNASRDRGQPELRPAQGDRGQFGLAEEPAGDPGGRPSAGGPGAQIILPWMHLFHNQILSVTQASD